MPRMMNGYDDGFNSGKKSKQKKYFKKKNKLTDSEKYRIAFSPWNVEYDKYKGVFWFYPDRPEEKQKHHERIRENKLREQIESDPVLKKMIDEIKNDETNTRLKMIEEKVSSQPVGDRLDVHQACVFLGCSLPTLYRKLRTGEIPAAKIGRAWRIDRADLEAYINSKKTKGKGIIKHHPVIGVRRKNIVDTKAAWKVAQIEYRREKK